MLRPAGAPGSSNRSLDGWRQVLTLLACKGRTPIW
jgi:hypothetical protein